MGYWKRGSNNDERPTKLRFKSDYSVGKVIATSLIDKVVGGVITAIFVILISRKG